MIIILTQDYFLHRHACVDIPFREWFLYHCLLTELQNKSFQTTRTQLIGCRCQFHNTRTFHCMFEWHLKARKFNLGQGNKIRARILWEVGAEPASCRQLLIGFQMSWPHIERLILFQLELFRMKISLLAYYEIQISSFAARFNEHHCDGFSTWYNFDIVV